MKNYKWASLDHKMVQDLETMMFIPEGHPFWEEFQIWLNDGNAPAPFQSVDQSREEALKQIDIQAEAVRQNYITPGSGQALAYQAKEEEARLYLNADPATRDQGNYPHLSAETGITAPTMAEVAELIATLAERWRVVSAHIESERARLKKAMKAAGSQEDIDAILRSVNWNLT